MNNDPRGKAEENLLNHDYDGIQELDNPLPRWWVQLFYVTIVFAVLYCGYFWFGPGLSISESFDKTMAAHAPKHQTSSPQDYSSIPTGEDWIKKGEVIFKGKCASCHGQQGEGLIGPNLTDNHWINGDGTLKAIVNVIQKGVPEKGMIAWESMMSGDDIVAAANYVKSLKGSNPLNGKAPEGQETTN